MGKSGEPFKFYKAARKEGKDQPQESLQQRHNATFK